MQIFSEPKELARAAAELFVVEAQRAISGNGRFVVALSGGNTPRAMHELLALAPYADQIDWSRVEVFWGDERYVPPSDAQSNERMARETLLSKVPVPETQIHSMYVPGGPNNAAEAYEEVLLNTLGRSPVFDLILLGLGPDGHTASLFPGQPAVHESERWVVPSHAPVNAADRISLTPPVLNAGKTVAFLVAGQDKAEALHRVLEGPENFDQTPAQAIARCARNVIWLVDQQAAAFWQ